MSPSRVGGRVMYKQTFKDRWKKKKCYFSHTSNTLQFALRQMLVGYQLRRMVCMLWIWLMCVYV